MNTSSESFKLEMLLNVIIEDDGYVASVVIRKTDTKHSFVSLDVTDYLRRHSVVFGFELKNIVEVLQKLTSGPENEKVVVARGKRLVEGEEGAEEYRFRTKLLVGAQTDQKTDYHERGLVNNVRAGQVIAILTKEIPGKPGIKVTGEKIEPKKVCSIKILKCGINVEMYTEGRVFSYVSMVSGNARKIFNEVQVTKDFIINGDLDYTKGNIDFVGNVGIFGDVKSGFSIRADGDIMITGNVEPNAKVCSKKNISVNKIVRCGMGKGMFEAEGDITAHTIINSKILAKGNVFIKDYIADSEVYCEGTFASSWGTILGCTVEAIGGFHVNKVGKSESMTKNTLYAGKSILSSTRLMEIETELQNLQHEMSLIIKKVTIKKKDDNSADLDDPREQNRIKQIGAARSQHVKQIKERTGELEEEKCYLQGRFLINPEAKIIVKGTIYPTALFFNGDNAVSAKDEEQQGLTLEYLDNTASK